MKKRRNGILIRVVPHLTLVLALLFLLLFVLDRFNENMAFLSHVITKWGLAVFCALSLCSAVALIADQWADDARQDARNALLAERRAKLAQDAAKAARTPDAPADKAL